MSSPDEGHDGAPGPRFFFVHVLKTGGTTLKRHGRHHFGAEAMYPLPGDDQATFRATQSVTALLELPPAARDRIALFTGHLPFYATDLLGLDVVRLSLVRDPVERVVSNLRHAQRTNPRHAGRTLEELYERPRLRRAFLVDHQTKVFGLTPEDGVDSCFSLAAPEPDEAMLERALANLERIDLLGRSDRYDAFLAALRERWGWPTRTIPPQNVGAGSDDVPAALRRRIAEDNELDLALWARARELAVG